MAGIAAGVAAALVVALAIPELASSYWLRVLTASSVLTGAPLATGGLYAQLGMVSLCQFALVGSAAGSRCAHGMRYIGPSKCHFCAAASARLCSA